MKAALPVLLMGILVSRADTPARAEVPLPLSPALAVAEQQQIATIERLSRSTVAIFEAAGTNGGSGVLISDSGLVVTNYHVTEPCGAKMLVGTSDGRLHDAVLLGLDPTGDIALVQLLSEGPFLPAKIANSDHVAVGDTAIVAGNPFLLAGDFTPSISKGIVSGVHRYQPPSGTLLEYADCLQTDAAINPGNSGGPLFNGHGHLIGINGRGSFEKRGRVNVGVGYAVSINQVMRFVSHLRTGRIVDHASLGATVVTRRSPRTVVNAIERDSDAYRRGLRPGDEIVSLGGRDTPTANALLNAVGVLPAGWRTELEYRREGRLYRTVVRLGPLHSPGELLQAVASDPANLPDLPLTQYEYREGYANYAATRRETERLLRSCRSERAAALQQQAEYVDTTTEETVRLQVASDSAEWLSRSGEFRCDPSRNLASQAFPPDAPGLIGALWVWSRLTVGEEGLIDQVEAFGRVPWMVDQSPADVLIATHRGLQVEVYLEPATGEPLGLEASRDPSEDSVRIEFVRNADNETTTTALPAGMTIWYGDTRFADLREVRDRTAEQAQ